MIIKKIKGNADIKIYPVSDMHIGASEFMYAKWNEFKTKDAFTGIERHTDGNAQRQP